MEEFDVLPVVIEDTVSGLVQMFVLPKEYHKVTIIEHPKYPDLAKLGLRWCVVPTVTYFTIKLGGLEYGCCPFNGCVYFFIFGRGYFLLYNTNMVS